MHSALYNSSLRTVELNIAKSKSYENSLICADIEFLSHALLKSRTFGKLAEKSDLNIQAYVRDAYE